MFDLSVFLQLYLRLQRKNSASRLLWLFKCFFLEDANKKLEKKKKKQAKKGRVKGIAHRPNLDKEDPPSQPSLQKLPKITIGYIILEMPKEEHIELDFSNMSFPRVFLIKEVLRKGAEFSAAKKPILRTRKAIPIQVRRRQGNSKRFDVVGPVKVKTPSKEVILGLSTQTWKIEEDSPMLQDLKSTMYLKKFREAGINLQVFQRD